MISSPIRQGSVPDTSQSSSNLPPKMSPQLLSSDLCDGPVPVRIQQTRAPLTNQSKSHLSRGIGKKNKALKIPKCSF